MRLSLCFTFLFQCVLGITVSVAQDLSKDTLQIRVWYRYKQINDTVQKNGFEEQMCLDIGKRISYYYSENKYKRDSMLSQQVKSGKSLAELLAIRGSLPTVKVRESVYKNYPKAQTLLFLTSIFSNRYLYHEKMPIVQWKILDEYQEILGYKVQKATASYAGRQYEAWFVAEIPISEGPWKFSGLPGLILKVNDSQNYFSFTAIGLKQMSADKVYLVSLDKLKKKKNEKFFELSRKVFIATIKEYKLNPYILMESMGINSTDKNGHPIRSRAPRPINLMEKY